MGDWDTGSVLSMEYTFADAVAFNQPLAQWDVSNVQLTYAMFGCYTVGVLCNFNQPLGDWDVSSVVDMGT